MVSETVHGRPQSANEPLPNNPEIGQQNLWQIIIGEVVEGCDVQDTVDDGSAGECGSGV
jgi:hypothetical protein